MTKSMGLIYIALADSVQQTQAVGCLLRTVLTSGLRLLLAVCGPRSPSRGKGSWPKKITGAGVGAAGKGDGCCD